MKRRRSNLSEQILQRSRQPQKENRKRPDFISTGSVALNLALSQRGRDGGWARGHIGNIVGDGSTGKTILSIETAAAFFHKLNPDPINFAPVKSLQIVYNNVEGVMDFPLERMYGEEFVDGVEWIRTETVEAFGRDVHRRVLELKEGEALLYIADSIDAMVSEVGKKRAEDEALGKKVSGGTYGVDKAKYFSSEFFNNLCNMTAGKDATILMVSQVRENLNAGLFGKKFYRTGGKALNFYTHQVVWLYQIDKLEQTFRKRKRVYGVKIRAKVERNKVAPPYREMDMPIIFDYGVDDVGAMADYLGAQIDRENISPNSPEYNGLAKKIEQEWAEEEAAVKSERKGKYE